mmetsp:Transcript_2328/g.7482  ORF Transcript_2328/g.7482 Transcript_2328/m.7482 type:complete len:102 (-) Transcript_2328:2247-2552(-)|eukprot:scaffold42675_cov30-Tisochrysis_lutea.AAC.1
MTKLRTSLLIGANNQKVETCQAFKSTTVSIRKALSSMFSLGAAEEIRAQLHGSPHQERKSRNHTMGKIATQRWGERRARDSLGNAKSVACILKSESHGSAA